MAAWVSDLYLDYQESSRAPKVGSPYHMDGTQHMDSSLPPVQLKESHALALDAWDIPVKGSYTLAIAPSARTTPGDTVHITWQGFFQDGGSDEPFIGADTVVIKDQVLSWGLDPVYALFIDGGTAQISYRVEYADAQGGSVESEKQTIAIKPPPAGRLTALSIENHTGGPIDPDDYPLGLELNVEVYTDIQVDDGVLCYIKGGAGEPLVIDYLLVDQSIIDKGTLQFTVEQSWLENNKDATAVFEYQYARYGKAESSYALSILIEKAFHPLAPIIDGALPETSGTGRPHTKAPAQGYIDALSLRAGARVMIPASVELIDGDTVEVHWQGFGTSGHYIANVSDPNDERLFLIPASAVPANMDKRVNVLYRINRSAKTLITSEVFSLRIRPLPTHSYPTVQCSCTDIGKLLLNCVPESGAVVTLGKWIFMAPGQRLTIEASSWTSERLLSDFPITQTHIDQGKVTATLSKSFLTQLGDGAPLTLNVSVSFDEGNSLTTFPALPLLLAIRQLDDHDVESNVCIQPLGNASRDYVDHATVGMSKNQLIDWMRVKPRTMGWGAILAFNRKDTNTVLLQEYINRFSTGDYLRPIEHYIATTMATGQFITGYQMDYPRLSFETANIDRETADAKLTMKVVGGAQVTFTHIPGGKEPTLISIIDPLNGPVLTLDVELVDVPGSVNSAGKVVLDLSKSSHFSLSFSDFLHEQELGGLFFRELFERLPDSQRRVTISEITKHPGDVIKPAAFKLRTQAAPGSKKRNASNYGDGSVLVLVAMEGENNGGNPGADFPYLIPNDTNNSAMLLMSNKLFLEATIGEAMVRQGLIAPGDWILLPEGADVFKTLHTGSPTFRNIHYGFRYEDFQCEITLAVDKTNLEMDSGATGRVQDGRIDLALKLSDIKAVDSSIRADTWPATKNAYFNAAFNIALHCNYEIASETHVLTPVNLRVDESEIGFPVHQPPPLNDPVAERAFRSTEALLASRASGELNIVLRYVLEKLPDINVFALQSILFKSGDSIVFDDVALPGDMALFGHLGASVTHFSISPLEQVVGVGDTVQFTTDPIITGLTWSAERIAGETGYAGAISADGTYVAPPSIDGAPFIRVKITARAGIYSSSALISIVISDIAVNPVIQTCGANQERSLSAGSRGDGTLQWSLKTPSNGGALSKSDGFKNIYKAPPAASEVPYFIDEVVVKNIQTGKERSSYLMVLNATFPLNVMRDFSYSSVTSTRLIVKTGNTVMPIENITWEILLGSGHIENGLYTPPSPLEHNFALILATFTLFPGFTGYILVPLPLFDYPEDTALMTPEFLPAYRPHLK
ncbi:hypothetical protein ALP05_03231 [Pseudomonas caricapapayae]|uniref:Uncharacterized protein n=3 Tax=Pseudomonas caricapapayae TaxID=46678 RepID=A0A3M6EL98_9PSED|nr:hypothetical protein ALP05_03231 [Pseudomonas caricapapayae]